MVKVLKSLKRGTMNAAILSFRLERSNPQEMIDAAEAQLQALLDARPTIDALHLRPSEMVFVLSVGAASTAPQCCIDQILQCHVASATGVLRNGNRQSWCSDFDRKFSRHHAEHFHDDPPLSEFWGLDFRLRDPILHEPNREIPEGWQGEAPKVEDAFDPLVVSMCVVDPNLNRAAVLLHDQYWSHLATLSERGYDYVGDELDRDPFSDFTRDYTPARLNSGELVKRDVSFTLHSSGRQGTGPDDFAANGFRPDPSLRPYAVAVDRILVEGGVHDYNHYKTPNRWTNVDPAPLIYDDHPSCADFCWRCMKPGEFDGYLRGPSLIWFPL
jgi:hypothetical protein